MAERHVHNIDLHYHAGQERQSGTTLEGYLKHAVITGRVVLGLTDHLEKYISLNLPAPLQMLWAAYRILQEQGVTFVPGSDQHAYQRTATRREGRYVPLHAFDFLGVAADDLPFVQQLLARSARWVVEQSA